LAFSPDEKTLAAGEPGGIIRLRDVATGEIQAEFPPVGNVVGLAFSPSGELLASCGAGKVVLWHLQKRESLGILQQNTGSMYAVAFSPDGRILATGGKAGTITLWDVETRVTLGTIQSDGWIWSLDFSPDGEVLASGGNDHEVATVRLWDWAMRKQLAMIPKALGPVAFSPDGTILVCQSFSGIKLLDRGTKRIRETTGAPGSFLYSSHSRLALFPDGQTLAMVRNGRVTLWDLATGRELPMVRAFPHWVFSVAVSPNGRTLATGGADGTVQLWHSKIDRGGLASAPWISPGPGSFDIGLSEEDCPGRSKDHETHQ
jgi:WD40 repeat protein